MHGCSPWIWRWGRSSGRKSPNRTKDSSFLLIETFPDKVVEVVLQCCHLHQVVASLIGRSDLVRSFVERYTVRVSWKRNKRTKVSVWPYAYRLVVPRNLIQLKFLGCSLVHRRKENGMHTVVFLKSLLFLWLGTLTSCALHISNRYGIQSHFSLRDSSNNVIKTQAFDITHFSSSLLEAEGGLGYNHNLALFHR